MPNSSSTTPWYGNLPPQPPGPRAFVVPALVWGGILLVLAAVRLALPFYDTDAQFVHGRIVEALAAGRVWGRQAMVGSLEFPPLPTLGMMFARPLGLACGLPAGSVLVVIAQVWAAYYVLRIPQTARGRAVTVASLLVLVVCPQARRLLLSADPNWIAAVPAACALSHLVRWQQAPALRDLVLLAVCNGFLVLCGPAGMLLALALGVVVHAQAGRLAGPGGLADTRGVRPLLWAPPVYAVVLILLGNWLVMNDFLFPWRRPFDALLSLGARLPRAAVLWIPLGGLAMAVVGRARLREAAANGVALGLVGLAACGRMWEAMRVLLPGGGILLVVVGLCGLLGPGFHAFERLTRPWQRQAVPLLLAATVFAAFAFAPPPPPPARLLSAPPTAAAVTAMADRYWANARIMVCGLRAPAVYFDPRERRFLTRVDFSEKTLAWQARREQLYLLVPPNDGTDYALRHGPLADIHQRGRSWLLLEATWPPGWQLWRCIIYDPEAARPSAP